MTSQKYQTEAIVLQEYRVGEADKVLTLYSPGQGKFRAVARGVRRPGSRLGGNVALLNHSLLQLARRRSLDLITQAETLDSFLSMKSDLRRLSCGMYAAELVAAFTPDQLPSQPVFDLLRDTLHRLSDPVSQETLLSHFELHLLHHLGYRPQLHKCVSCSEPLRPVAQSFSPAQGGIICPECGWKEPMASAISLNALKVLRLWQDCDYPTAARVRLDQQLSAGVRQLMKDYVGYLLDRKVKSLSWLEKLGQAPPPPTGP